MKPWMMAGRRLWLSAPDRLAGEPCKECGTPLPRWPEQGNNLIVDAVLCDGKMPEYVKLLWAFDLHLVGVFAPLDILEARERARGDRLVGLARWQYGRVHKDVAYDLQIDTSTATLPSAPNAYERHFGCSRR